ncbi:hypothetical protein FAIPA1_20309 [Frankia sp. AiPs1]
MVWDISSPEGHRGRVRHLGR